MITCNKCNKNRASKAIGICANCLRDLPDKLDLSYIHSPTRKKFGLPEKPPKDTKGILCLYCANECQISEKNMGFCGLRLNISGRIKNRAAHRSALAHMYLDPLPTNCCADWFCKGHRKKGYNLAVFFYGCSFDCLYCQNASHKLLEDASTVSEDEMVRAALNPMVRCVCFFGGSPEPQFPFALRVSKRILRGSHNNKHICWEWNGCGNPSLVKEAAELAKKTNGTVKFDLKAFHPKIIQAMCGVVNRQTFFNFTTLAQIYSNSELITATTLLVPYYVDKYEVENISKFIAKINQDIPYSLLIFHPDFYMSDLPITPKQQIYECYETAKKYLNRVHLGNQHLLQYSN
jgi:pyruvate formate lyase activating enzyme